ncbi:MAG TPA: GNAT family N-acetyltransferase [Bacillota bacterium]|nr:GNAT family N-acetyltransferase [Bacillota bacterium]
MDTMWKINCKNGQEVTLRPAVPEDAQQLLATINSVAKERSYMLTELSGKSAVEGHEFISRLDSSKYLLLVAEMGDQIVGALGVNPTAPGRDQRDSQACDIGVHLLSGFREQGVGSKMLEYALEWAREKCYRRISACIFTSNKRSLNLFRKFGFLQEAKSKKQFRLGTETIEEVIMAKMLH